MKLTRRRFVGITVGLALLAVYFFALPHFTPPLTPLSARAAMAEAGVCEADAPIIERDGRISIGGYDFVGASFTTPPEKLGQPPGGLVSYGNFYFQPAVASWLPGGRWKVRVQRV
jgi:hypothetical protein